MQPPNHDEFDTTVTMPRIEVPPPARPGTYAQAPGPVEEAVVVGPAPPRVLKPVGPRVAVGDPVGYTLARCAAFLLDAGLVAGVFTLLAYALIAINPLTGLPTNSQRGFDATLGIGMVLALTYVIAAEALFGTTIGKLAFGLHVYALRDRNVGFARAFVRMLLRPLDLLGIGALLSILPGRRRLGDLAAGTIVTRESPLRRFAPYAGWLAVLVLGGLPFVTVGMPRTFAGLVAFVEFAPGIGARIALVAHHLIAALPHG